MQLVNAVGKVQFREDECILLSALLNFGVHKKMVHIDKKGIEGGKNDGNR